MTGISTGRFEATRSPATLLDRDHRRGGSTSGRCPAAGIGLDRLDNWTLNSKEDADIEAEMMKAMDIPFDIVPLSDCSLSDTRIKAEALKKRSGVDQIIIDHAKMISLPGKADLYRDDIPLVA